MKDFDSYGLLLPLHVRQFAGVVLLLFCTAFSAAHADPLPPIAPKTVHLEAEDGEMLSGTVVQTAGTGFLGKGYVGGFTAPEAAVRLRFAANAGIYEVRIRYRTTAPKGYDLVVNGKKKFGNVRPDTR